MPLPLCEKARLHLPPPSVSPELRPRLMENAHFIVFSGSAMGLSPGGYPLCDHLKSSLADGLAKAGNNAQHRALL